MQLKIESIQNQIDLRVESLITEVHEYRDKCMNNLGKYKDDLKKSTFMKIIFIYSIISNLTYFLKQIDCGNKYSSFSE